MLINNFIFENMCTPNSLSFPINSRGKAVVPRCVFLCFLAHLNIQGSASSSTAVSLTPPVFSRGLHCNLEPWLKIRFFTFSTEILDQDNSWYTNFCFHYTTSITWLTIAVCRVKLNVSETDSCGAFFSKLFHWTSKSPRIKVVGFKILYNFLASNLSKNCSEQVVLKLFFWIFRKALSN